MKLFGKLRAYGRVLRRGRRNRSDLGRRLLRRPQILLGVTAYELALLGSSAVDGGIKALASIKAASLCRLLVLTGHRLCRRQGSGRH